MNIPFPVLTPRLIDPRWFNPDSPCDEEAEIAALEREHQARMGSIDLRYKKTVPVSKVEPKPMEEEVETDEEEANEESEETEESHDEDEPMSYSPQRNNNEVEADSLDEMNEANTSDQSASWPI